MMSLELNEKRKEITKYIAHKEAGIETIEDKSIDEILKEKEIRLIEKEENKQKSKNCYWYIFKDKIWFKQLAHTEARNLLIDTGITALKKKGYIEVDEPQDNDIVIYSFKHKMNLEENMQEAEHYGIYKNNKVISKFGQGNVYEHPLEKVPDIYGNVITFLRKKIPKQKITIDDTVE